MKKYALLFALLVAGFLSLCAGQGYAGDTREIELTDGSVITGEVVSLSKGTYTIRTDSLGLVTVEEAKIRSIRAKGSPASVSTPSDAGGQEQSLQKKMMSDPEIMSMIQSLQNDPDFKKILEDPELMRAVQSGDLAALTANPQFMKLLNNQKVQEIHRKVEK